MIQKASVHNKWLLTLTMITLSGFRCTDKPDYNNHPWLLCRSIHDSRGGGGRGLTPLGILARTSGTPSPGFSTRVHL